MPHNSFRRMADGSLADRYRSEGWWSDETLVDALREHSRERPDAAAFVSADLTLSWRELDDASTHVAACLVAEGIAAGDRVAVWMPDTPLVHVALLAAEKAGVTAVGIGARAGSREVTHLMRRTAASAILTSGTNSSRVGPLLEALRRDGRDFQHLVVEATPPAGPVGVFLGDRAAVPEPIDDSGWEERRIRADDLFLINSTSGTTGLPKCVQHTQNRWRYFHHKAAENGALNSDDVFLGAVPAPFGFGLWTSHVSPILLGTPTVLLERFSPEAAFEAIERHKVTVLCCVSTQFLMMLASPGLTQHDLSSLRVMFTGGEAVPYERALEFERATGVTILQFYGSNETGLLSGTTLEDSLDRRLRTAGRIVPEMQVRLFDGDQDVTASGRGQPACKGPATSIGYLDDDAANDELFTSDGWMLMGDICEIDQEGYLTVVGRTSDFIIRGGKNISAAQVESDVVTHERVAHAAAVAMPDAVFGERVCVYVELIGDAPFELDDLVSHLAANGVSKELFPERMIVLDQLPRSSGAKVAKGELRKDIRRRVEIESASNGNTIPDETIGAQ